MFLAQSGANVILLARREDKLSQVLAACQEANPKGTLYLRLCDQLLNGAKGIFHPVTMDVLDRKAVDGLVESLPDNLKDISFLVNNAGTQSPHLVENRTNTAQEELRVLRRSATLH